MPARVDKRFLSQISKLDEQASQLLRFVLIKLVVIDAKPIVENTLIHTAVIHGEQRVTIDQMPQIGACSIQTTLHITAHNPVWRSRTMISPAGEVLRCTPAELGVRHNNGIIPFSISD